MTSLPLLSPGSMTSTVPMAEVVGETAMAQLAEMEAVVKRMEEPTKIPLYGCYGHWKYTRSSLKAVVGATVKAVHELLKDPQVPVFDGVCLSGTSGTWLGAALQLHQDWPEHLPVVLVRKAKESSHGSRVEGVASVSRLLLIDDFVSSGETALRVRDTLKDYSIGLVAVLEHAGLVDEDEWYEVEQPLHRCPYRTPCAEMPVYRRRRREG